MTPETPQETPPPPVAPSLSRARQDLNVAQLTAKAELVMEELTGVIADMAALLRRGALDVGGDTGAGNG